MTLKTVEYVSGFVSRKRNIRLHFLRIGFVVLCLIAGSVQAQLIPAMSSEMNGSTDAWVGWAGGTQPSLTVDMAAVPGKARLTAAPGDNLGGLTIPGGIGDGTLAPPWHMEMKLNRPLDQNTSMGYLMPAGTDGTQGLWTALPVPGGAGPGGATWFFGAAFWTGGHPVPDFSAFAESEFSGTDLEIYFGVLENDGAPTTRWGFRLAGASTWNFAPDTTGGNTYGFGSVNLMIEMRQPWFDQWGISAPASDLVVDVDYVRVYSSMDSEAAFIHQTGTSTDVAELGETSDTYTIEFASEPNDITITINFDAAQVTVVPGSLTITSANWVDDHIITVTAVDDAVTEDPHQTTITHSVTAGAPGANFVFDDVVVNIADNDTPGVVVTESSGSTDLLEGDPGTDTYDVALLSVPSADVTISINTDSQTAVQSPVSGDLTFTSINWSTPQTVTIAVVDDNLSEGPHTGTISHSAVSGDGNYQGIAIADVSAIITDNEPFCGTASGGTLPSNPADISGPLGVPDCLVDFYDMIIISEEWLDDAQNVLQLTHPFNLEDRSRMAINAIKGALDSRGYPYLFAYLYPPYAQELPPGVLAGEYVDGLTMARIISNSIFGAEAEQLVTQAVLTQIVNGFGDSAGGSAIEIAGHKHLLPSLLTLHRLHPTDLQALTLMRDSLQRFYDIALTGDLNGEPYLYYPVPTDQGGGIGWSGILYDTLTGWPTPNMEPITTGSAGFEGAITLPFAQYYELTGDPLADEFLDKFIRFLLERATDFNPDGSFTKTDVVNGQVWSRMMTNEGILIYGLASGRTDLVNWARTVFDKALELHGTRFGWLPENLAFNHGQGCETDTMTAQIETAFLLARKVDDAYWDVAERIAMNQLLAQQLRRADFLDNTERLIGTFHSFCRPDDWHNPQGQNFTQSSHGSGMRALYNVWYHAAWWEEGAVPGEAGRTLRVNLHWSKNIPGAQIISYLPGSTQLEVKLWRSCDLIVRKPDWAALGQISVEAQPMAGGAAVAVPITLNGRWMHLGHFDAGTKVTLTFPEDIVVQQDVIHNRAQGVDYPYTTQWRGNAVISISPAGSVHPNYEERDQITTPYIPEHTPRFALDPIQMTPLEYTEELRSEQIVQ